MIIGGGVRISNAHKELYEFLKKINIPIITTWTGLDVIDYKHKNYIGTIGVYGSRAANFVTQNADLILNFGSRLDTRVTGGKPKTFARCAKIISIDIDRHELNKKRGLNIYMKINLDLKSFLSSAKAHLKGYNYSITERWESICQKWKLDYPNVTRLHYEQKKYVNPYCLFDKLSNKLNNKDIIVGDTGSNLICKFSNWFNH